MSRTKREVNITRSNRASQRRVKYTDDIDMCCTMKKEEIKTQLNHVT